MTPEQKKKHYRRKYQADRKRDLAYTPRHAQGLWRAYEETLPHIIAWYRRSAGR